MANSSHTFYAERICEIIFLSAQERGTGIAKRSPEYITGKMKDGKAIIAIDGEEVVGFAYIETWSHCKFVANSGLIVAHSHRNRGLARRIKERIFSLSKESYPNSKIFSITTGLAVMKINYELGFRPVTFSELTDDQDFWKGCEGCGNYDILLRNNHRMCLCTGLLYDPHPTKSTDNR